MSKKRERDLENQRGGVRVWSSLYLVSEKSGVSSSGKEKGVRIEWHEAALLLSFYMIHVTQSASRAGGRTRVGHNKHKMACNMFQTAVNVVVARTIRQKYNSGDIKKKQKTTTRATSPQNDAFLKDWVVQTLFLKPDNTPSRLDLQLAYWLCLRKANLPSKQRRFFLVERLCFRHLTFQFIHNPEKYHKQMAILLP